MLVSYVFFSHRLSGSSTLRCEIKQRCQRKYKIWKANIHTNEKPQRKKIFHQDEVNNMFMLAALIRIITKKKSPQINNAASPFTAVDRNYFGVIINFNVEISNLIFDDKFIIK